MIEALAKQLKEAGFPQRGKDGKLHLPSLQEVIFECGEQFWSLRRTPEGKWLASGRLAAKKNQIPYYETVTYDEPDAAVAELYLSIKLHEQEGGS